MTDNNIASQQMNVASQQMIHNQQIRQNGIGQQMLQNQQTQQQLPQYNYQQAFNSPYYQNNAVNPYAGYQQWDNNQNILQSQPSQQTQYIQQDNKPHDFEEYILIDGSAPNKKRKYVFVGEVDMQTNAVQLLPSFTLEDVRKVIAHEFDVRFGEEKK